MTARPQAVRVDKWLWAVRAVRTRTAATDACSAGRVAVNGDPAKPATRVAVGDTVTARLRHRTIVYQVRQLIEKRVSAALAAECFDDRSPPPEPTDRRVPGPDAASAVRERGAGRPTKRDRRRIDELRGRR